MEAGRDDVRGKERKLLDGILLVCAEKTSQDTEFSFRILGSACRLATDAAPDRSGTRLDPKTPDAYAVVLGESCAGLREALGQ